ncbi:hypothetical protein ABH931_007831 [Streptacidiphilus sp. MAP12-33]|uniref:hypothetical protein n=1 Tax=Streptacidiphilus sp. MAP12-33 TaxID=3156266 RepID=UPI0035139685
MLPHRPNPRRRSPRRRTSRRLPLLAGLLTALLGLAALLGSALAATAPNPPGAPAAQPPAVPNADCTLKVPAAPLTAVGLASPYLLTATDAAKGPCHEADAAQSAFVQATVLNPATGAVFVYDPLVIDRGTRPARAAVVPKLPAHAVVGLWFGFNGNNLTLGGSTAAGRCVNGTRGSIFGQFAYCNAPAFFSAARGAERAGRLKVPPLGVGRDGAPCPTTRDFGIVDQDQSDNVTTAYLATPDGRIAQRTAADTAALGPQGAVDLANGSDNLLLTAFVDPALGCTPWTAPDLADPGHRATALALDELQAAADQGTPVALVPRNDPMVLGANGAQSRTKTNLYRVGVDQAPVGAGKGTDQGDGPTYCARLASGGAARLTADGALFTAAVSPTTGQNLADFLSQRLAASLQNLGCPQQQSATPAGPGSPSPSPSPSASASASATGTGPAAPASGAPTATGTGAPASEAPASDTPTGTGAASPKLVPPAGAGGTPGTAEGAGPADSPSLALVGDVVPSPSPVLPSAVASGGAGMIGSATMIAAPSVTASVATSVTASTKAPVRATPTHGRLADTGASPRLWPFAGMAVAVLLLGCSVRLLTGARRHPQRRH